ncbi:hypothetical protein NQZ68_004909 [Dissostichus eleginoides]|nr:hypothetical protein NQZ68_004909 [Dissostichus eleginoides]
MVRYSLTYPVTTTPTTRYAPGLQEQGGPGLRIFLLFKLDSVSSEKRPVWQSAPYPSKKEHYPPVLGAERHMHAHSDTHVTSSAFTFTAPQRASLDSSEAQTPSCRALCQEPESHGHVPQSLSCQGEGSGEQRPAFRLPHGGLGWGRVSLYLP